MQLGKRNRETIVPQNDTAWQESEATGNDGVRSVDTNAI